MKHEDVIIGMKVIIISKFNNKLDDSLIYRHIKENNQNFAYVNSILKDYNPIIYVLSDKLYNFITGDFFYVEDFIPNIKEERKDKLKKLQN